MPLGHPAPGTIAQVAGSAPASGSVLMHSAASSPARKERGPDHRIEAQFGAIINIEWGYPEVQARPPVRMTTGVRAEPMRRRSGHVDAGIAR
jgi:hypothetical protein